MGYALSATVDRPYETVLAQVRTALADQGFGILTEIDLKATMKAKLDAELAPQVILGACRPPLALAALQAGPSIGLLLPCNVVVRSTDDQTTVVEALDPYTMVDLTANPARSRALLTAASWVTTSSHCLPSSSMRMTAVSCPWARLRRLVTGPRLPGSSCTITPPRIPSRSLRRSGCPGPR